MNTRTIETIKEAAHTLTAQQRRQGYQAEGLHIYTDADDEVIYCRIRMKHPETGDKWIRPLRRNASGAWCELKEPPFPDGKPLYLLHKLAALPDATVMLVEGERCADWLAKLNIMATTSGSADSVRLADWQPLAGRDVLIWPDNDTAGRKYAEDATAKLAALGSKVKLVDIDALKLPPKGDCVDWLQLFEQQHGRKATAEDVWELPVIKGAPRTVEAVGSDSSSSVAADAAAPVPEYNAQPDTPPAQSDDEIIQWLASLKPFEYERVRIEQAKAMKCRPAVLDKAVREVRNEEIEANRLPFAEVEPHPEPISPEQLLNEISDTIRRFIVLDIVYAHAAALWIAYTWFIDVVEVAPLAIITAPEKACGKSQLMELLGRMVRRPLPASNASTAGLFRAVDLWNPTVLIDEADTFINENEEMKGLINAGHTRGNAFVLRVVGDKHEPRLFPVWGAKAFAGIALEKHLPDATMSRAIVFELRRKLTHESVSRLRHADEGLFEAISAKLARFAADYSQKVRLARPTLPDALSDRAQDNWEPLLAIAECAGTEWTTRATMAALKLSGTSEKTMSTGNQLLADIQHIFESKRVDKISVADLIAALCNDEEGAWATYNRGKPISGRQIATRLSSYDIRSKSIRFGYNVSRGFELSQFDDAFTRYLSESPAFSVTTLQTSNDAALNVTDGNNVTVTQQPSVTRESMPLLGCNTATDKNLISGDAKESRLNTSHLII